MRSQYRPTSSGAICGRLPRWPVLSCRRIPWRRLFGRMSARLFGSGSLSDRRPIRKKKRVSVRTVCVLTHQALGTLWTHPGSAHTAPNAKCTGNVNSDAARHGAVRLDAARHGISLPDRAWQGIFLLDAAWQGIFLLDAAVSGQMVSRQRVS